MSLKDNRLTNAFKVEVQLAGIDQDLTSIGATLHYQMAYRLQDHAFDLSLPTAEEALLVLIDSTQVLICTHIPRQISTDDLMKILPSSWITNYEMLHQPQKFVQTLTEPSYHKKEDDSFKIVFDITQTKTPSCFTTQYMMTYVTPTDVEIQSFDSQVKYSTPKDLPDSPPEPTGWDIELPPADSQEPPLSAPQQNILPCYKKATKWMRHHGEVFPAQNQFQQIPQVCMMTTPANESDFPSLKKFNKQDDQEDKKGKEEESPSQPTDELKQLRVHPATNPLSQMIQHTSTLHIAKKETDSDDQNTSASSEDSSDDWSKEMSSTSNDTIPSNPESLSSENLSSDDDGAVPHLMVQPVESNS
ncbi:uncharacterized protein LOC133815278 [Humulus lupulus]|uniref:uncharacterized protein LOC133815278 n=1 Tax=Humulus lupulus TaxID=3486 RepID=UPI002B40A2C2|nr:uncharacterized protein LOC133815278 [Humulus lupulus]